MTLYRQLTIAVAILFILLFGVNVVVGVYHTRELVEQQMQVHSQDTATSVALSMTQAAQEQDMASLDTMFNAVSDSGYFKSMTYRNLDGKVLIERRFPVQIESVPSWFIEYVPLPSPEGRAEVASGWMRLGELIVVSHPGQAYNKLWQVAKDQLTWFALITVAICILAAFALRVLLQPLSRVESQADSICEKQFVVQERIPRTRELKRVVEAMNRMAKRLKSIFESQLDLISQLQEQSLRDAVTGLSNRLDFDTRFRSFVRPETGTVAGALMILSVKDFERVNAKAGREEGNAVLTSIGERLVAGVSQYPQSIVARRQGPEFTVFVPNLINGESEQLAQSLFDAAMGVEWMHHERDPLVCHMGFTYTDKVLDAIEMLREADLALKQAIEEGPANWKNLAEINSSSEAPVLVAPVEEWLERLQAAVANKSTSLLYQPIYSSSRDLVGHEVYSRLSNGGSMISAGIFMPLAERFGLAYQFDKLALESLAQNIGHIQDGHYVCVNMSASSVQNNEFIGWLAGFLDANDRVAKALVVELPEHAMHVEEHEIRSLADILNARGARLGIDHFGLASSAFGYLGTLKLHHIKVHRSFVRGLEESAENRFYIQSLAQVARSRDIQLMIEGVEREEEWSTLIELGIDAGQGYLLGEPRPEPVSS